MTSVGCRPTLEELILALHAIKSVEADIDALNPERETFRVALTFQRDRCPNDWIYGQPKPTWLFEQLIEELKAWRQQRIREEQWVSKEEQFGASIGTLMMYWTEELKKNDAIRPENLLTRSMKQILSNTIVRLKELKERREAGAVYSATESRREKARRSWMEDEYEAPKREEEQRRQQEKSDFAGGFWERAYEGHSGDETFFFGFDMGARQKRPDPQKPSSGNQQPWYAILGVSVGATREEIKKAHRKLTAKYHPDRYKEADGHERMTAINTARDEGLGGV